MLFCMYQNCYLDLPYFMQNYQYYFHNRWNPCISYCRTRSYQMAEELVLLRNMSANY